MHRAVDDGTWLLRMPDEGAQLYLARLSLLQWSCLGAKAAAVVVVVVVVGRSHTGCRKSCLGRQIYIQDVIGGVAGSASPVSECPPSQPSIINIKSILFASSPPNIVFSQPAFPAHPPQQTPTCHDRNASPVRALRTQQPPPSPHGPYPRHQPPCILHGTNLNAILPRSTLPLTSDILFRSTHPLSALPSPVTRHGKHPPPPLFTLPQNSKREMRRNFLVKGLRRR
jgi:hypothetical protein